MIAIGNKIATICQLRSILNLKFHNSYLECQLRSILTRMHSSWKQKRTGTAQKGIVLSFNGYLRSVIIPSPTKRWNGSIIFKIPSMIARTKRINQSCICVLATLAPCDLIVCLFNRSSGIFLKQMTKIVLFKIKKTQEIREIQYQKKKIGT